MKTGANRLILASIVLPLLGAATPEKPAAFTLEDAETLTLQVGRSQHYLPPWPVAGISLTDPKVADVQLPTQDLILVTGTAPGTTDVFAWSEDGENRTIKIVVELDTDVITSDLATLFPGADLSVTESRFGVLVTGTLGSADDAAGLRSYLDSMDMPYVDRTALPGVQQVQVKVKIAEVSRDALRALGVNAFATGPEAFGASVIGGSGPINPVNIGPPDGAPADGTGTPFVFNDAVDVSPSVTLFGGIPQADLEIFIRALADNQFLRIMAEPTLVARSGEAASFLAGGEFPIPVVQGGSGGGGSTSITIEFKEFGVGLKFTPVVLGDGVIQLTVDSEVSDITDIGAIEIEGFRVPSIVTRRAGTTLELSSGQTFAVAGLLRETVSAQVVRTPGLGSLPILGPLFRSIRYRKGETELLVLVTASLVAPSSDLVHAPLPGDGHLPPSDWELYVEGEIEGATPARLSPEKMQWMKDLGLERLQGPGAWAIHRSESSVPPTGPTPGDSRDGR